MTEGCVGCRIAAQLIGAATVSGADEVMDLATLTSRHEEDRQCERSSPAARASSARTCASASWREGHEVVCVDNLITGTPGQHRAPARATTASRSSATTSRIRWRSTARSTTCCTSPRRPARSITCNYPDPDAQGRLAGHAQHARPGQGQERPLPAGQHQRGLRRPASSTRSARTTGATSTRSASAAVYDEAKRFAEAMTMAYHRYHGVDTHIVRIFNTYGPRMRLDDGRVLPNFMGQALARRTADRLRRRLADAQLLLRRRPGRGHLPAAVRRLPRAGQPRQPRRGDASSNSPRRSWSCPAARAASNIKPLPQDDPRVRQPDISRARQLLGWEPRVGRHEGLQRTLAYFQAKVAAAAPGEAAPSRP